MAMNNNNLGQDEIVSDINMTPLIDIMLVLLIIFMVSSSAAIESGMNVDLPEATTTTQIPPKNVIVSLTKTGQIAVGGKPVSMSELKDLIAKSLAENNTTSVVIEGDGDSSLNSAFDVMNLAREAGAKDLSLAAKAKTL